MAKVQMAGNMVQPTRFAFVEFENADACQAAKLLSGAMLGGFGIVVNQAKSAIQAASMPVPPVKKVSVSCLIT